MKMLLKIFGALILLAIIAAFAAPMFISKDLIKQQLIAQVETATGRKLTIGGDLSIRLFPFAGVTAHDVALSDSVGDKPFVALKSLDVNVEVMPLLSKQIVVQKLTLDEPVIRLRKEASGKGNWEFSSSQVADVTKEKPEKQKKTAGLPGGIRLSDMHIANGTVSYRDEAAKSTIELAKVNASLSLNGMNDPLTIEGSAEWQKKTVKVKAVIDTLQALLDKKKSNVIASASSDLFDINFMGTATGDTYAGQMKVKSPSLTALQVWLNPGAKPATAAPLVLELSGDVKCDASRCDFTKASISLDKIKVQGKAGVAFAGAKPNITADFSADELDLNPFLPLEEKMSGGLLISDAYAATGWSREPMDFSGLNAVDANIAVDTKKLLVRKIKIGDTKFRAKIAGGKLDMDIADASLYGGKGNMSASVDSGGNIQKTMSISSVQAEPFLKDAMNEDHLSGTANMQVSVSGHGKSEYDIVSSLAGNGSVKFTDGAINGINIADMVRNVQSAFKANSGAQKTDFAELGGTFTIASGIVKNSDLAMKAPLMRLSGAGQVNLPARTVNYRLKPEIVETIQGQGGKEKQGFGVPILITGSLDNPTYAPDLQAVVQDAINDPQKMKDTVKSVEEQFKGENKKETLKGLRGLFKKKD